jgi:hypothetical protein
MLTNPIYQELLVQARLLSLEDEARLVEELMADLRQRIEEGQQYHSIMELKGLGKELWQGIDVEKYIEEERSSWRG